MTVVEREVVVPVVGERERRARVLEAAALEIEVRGWHQGSVCGIGGEVCVLGGIGAALEMDWGVYSERFQQFATCAAIWGGDLASLVGVGMPRHYALSEFNDGAADDASEVTFLLRWRAAEIRDGL